MEAASAAKAIDMATIIAAFAPVFAAAVGVQKLVEIADVLLEALAQRGSPERRAGIKRLAAGVLALLLGLAVTSQGGFGILHALGAAGTPGTATSVAWTDRLITALVIAGGTEAVNSIVKFLGYAKDERKLAAVPVKETGALPSLPAPMGFDTGAVPPMPLRG